MFIQLRRAVNLIWRFWKHNIVRQKYLMFFLTIMLDSYIADKYSQYDYIVEFGSKASSFAN
ncbi:hypothetical protein NBRC116583_32430 [Arenicella sp. 4NH20-0111]